MNTDGSKQENWLIVCENEIELFEYALVSLKIKVTNVVLKIRLFFLKCKNNCYTRKFCFHEYNTNYWIIFLSSTLLYPNTTFS